jgi:universal stress protein A
MTGKTNKANSVELPLAEAPVGLKRILVAVDFSPSSTNAFHHALTFASQFHAELIVLHVVPSGPGAFAAPHGIPQFSEDDLTFGEDNLRLLVDSAERESKVKARAILRLGLPSHEICEAAKEADSDLLVLGTHGYTGWKHFCIGSTAERIVRAAPCPVLVVREKEHNFVTGGLPIQ